MTTRFTDLTEIAAVDIADTDVMALSDVSASASRKVTISSLRTTVGAAELSQVQVEDDTSTVFGSVSGERLGQAVASNLNATGTAPLYGVRAWVNFNGTGTVAINGQGNVASITDNGVGRYRVNFTTDMPDTNYCILGTAQGILNDPNYIVTEDYTGTGRTVSGFDIRVAYTNDIAVDSISVNVAVIR